MPHDLSPSEQLAHSTVRIECESERGRSTGTGFFYSSLKTERGHVPVIITNKHVISGAKTGRIRITVATHDGRPQTGTIETFEIRNFEKQWILHPDPSVDLCVLPIFPIIQNVESRGIKLFFVSLDDSVLPTKQDLENFGALEEIIMIGYPNGIWDAKNNMPVIRRGVTATHPNMDYEGKREFMIDAACFPGSSGSPVFVYNVGSWSSRNGDMMMGSYRVKLLGLLYAGPQHTATGEIKIVDIASQQKAVSVSLIPNNLGLVIKSSRIKEMDEILRPIAG